MKYCTDDGKKVFDTVEDFEKYMKEQEVAQAKKRAEEEKIKLAKQRVDECLYAANLAVAKYESLSGKRLKYHINENGEIEAVEDRFPTDLIKFFW